MPAFSLTDRRLWTMAAYGAVCGLPLPLSGFTLRQWLSEGQVSLTLIGATASIGLAYVLKFLWSPLFDQVAPPLGLARFGRRRGWLLLIQPLLALSCLRLALSDPAAAPGLLLATAALVAFLSASQDVVVDAWRVETFPERMQGIALAAYVWGYRLALLISGAGAIGLVGLLGWPGSLAAIAALVAAGVLVTLAASEPQVATMPDTTLAFGARLRAAVVDPFMDFLGRPSAGRILAFVMLFKLGEALAHTMAVPFYRALGFDRAQVALATGVPSLLASLLGAAAGGWLVVRIGTGRALVITGFVQMASMGLYFALAESGGDGRILLAKIVLENVAEAMADAAFLTYLSTLCSTRFTATQYALLSSLAAVGLRTIGGFSGRLAEALGWPLFYAMTILAALPAMLVMVSLLRRPPELALTRPAAIP
jgi:PAT family beta-lactamase induction signal transducer AmpG